MEFNIPFFPYSCVPNKRCGKPQNNLLDKRVLSLTGTELDEALALASNAKCDNSAETCCHKDDVIPEPPPEEKLCKDIEGYR